MFILQLGGDFTKDDCLVIYDTKRQSIMIMEVDYEIRLDDTDHFKQIKVTMENVDIIVDIIINFISDDTISVNFHIYS